MPIIKDYKKAIKKIKDISSRFDIIKRKNELISVEEIINNVVRYGDNALIKYTKQFDKYTLKNIRIKKQDIDKSISSLDKELKTSLEVAIKRIREFQETNIPKSWIKTFSYGEKLGYKYTPLDSVGVYIPGGITPLISTVLMTVIPAQVAGVKRIAVFSPPPINLQILATCKLLNIKEIYQIGGAQAIAAAAYGTKSIPAVNKIVGPGNIYVTLAKKSVFGKIGIDGLFGPSEIAIVADKTANPQFLAIDLLSQLEHGSGLESALMITDSATIANATELELFRLVESLPNKKTILNSWKKNSAIILVNDIKKSIHLINDLAPEHLEIITKNPNSISKEIKNAGAIFLGTYSCESLGDYIAGPSHCLPTSGSAKFSSGLTVMDFLKKISVISFDKKSFTKIEKYARNIAYAENLKAHSDALKIRNTA